MKRILINLTETILKKQLGNNVVSLLLEEDGNYNYSGFYRYIKYFRYIRKSFCLDKSQINHLNELCVTYAKPVRLPLVLISQIQRSGGSLLSQLLDGHPEIYAHPHEIKIGFPRKWHWPKLDLTESSEHWFEILFEKQVINHFKKGYSKGHKSENRFPFIFFPFIQKNIFINYLNGVGRKTQRDIFDAYMTSFFGAWINNHNRIGDKKWVSGFTPRLVMNYNSVDNFFSTYPDGRLISIVRDPRNWCASAMNHFNSEAQYPDIPTSMNQWIENVKAIIRNKNKYKEKVLIISFEDLISKTRSILEEISRYLDISFDNCMLSPTFNGMLIDANSSFEVPKQNIIKKTLSRYEIYSKDELSLIEDMSGKVYSEVNEYILR